MKKRLISLLLVICMVFSLVPTAAFAAAASDTTTSVENPFKDVKESSWFYDAVLYARANGFFNGTSATTFDPNGSMTRGMFVTVLGRMAGVDIAKYKDQTSFTDVPASAYYAPYVAWAAKHGITSGTGNGKFSPDKAITRQDMATLFVRYFNLFEVDYDSDEEITTLPADLDSVASYAKDAVLALWKEGLLNGDGTSFDPAGLATRAQAATLAMRMDRVVDVWYKEPGIPSDRTRVDPTGEMVQYSVRFWDGDRLIETMMVEENRAPGAVPSIEKSSKENAILLGYFADPLFTQPFYAEEPVTADVDVYALYEEMAPIEELNFTSFAQMDMDPELSFEIVGEGSPTQAVVLEVMDGSDPVELGFTKSENGYIVFAENGFNPGCSYQLHLADGWTFYDKPETIRSASFSIIMDEVENLQMNDSILYIQDTDTLSYKVGNDVYDELTSSLVSAGGSFTYDGDTMPEVGQIICIYVGTHPDERYSGGDTLDPAVYVKVSSVQGDVVSFKQLDSNEQMELYNIPDNFPINVEALPEGLYGSVNIKDLDTEMYVTMMGDGYTKLNAMSKAKEALAVGDFVTLYVSQDSITSAEDLYYGQIIFYDAQTGEITYEQTTRQAILDSMNLYSSIETSGDDYITEEEKEELERDLLAQVEASGFAEDAAFMLADIITKTDGFSNVKGLESLVITDANGNTLSPEDLQLMNLGGTFELSDDIKLTVELITKGNQLHFDGGIQLAIGIEANFEVEVEDDGSIKIELAATFVQEVMISPTVKGNIVYKEIFWIPVPIGVKVGATIDIMSFTAFSFEAKIYTVAAEDKSVWDKIKGIAEKPLDSLGLDSLPGDLIEGLNTVGDIMDKIEELQELAQKAEDVNGQIQGYLDDAAALWAVVEENGLTSKEDWAAMNEALGQTSVTSDLLEMMDLTNETGLSTEYYDTFEALMERYCEMLEQESDWVTLVEQKIFAAEYCIFGVVIGVETNFVIRADMSLAIGSNLQYQVGKRYEFWFKIGLFKPSAGSSTMDLIDEQFAFQFYVMGRLGLKAGIKAKFYVGIGSGEFASVGITAELGPYIKIYGFFVYEYTRFRAANTSDWVSNERMGGALFFEFGLYIIIGFEANALGDLFEYSHDFLDEEIPLLTAGIRRYYYDFDYAPAEDEILLVKDEDNNSTNGITMMLPEHVLSLKFVELTSGLMAYEVRDLENYIFTLSNPNFSIDKETGLISVVVPENTRYMECDLTITYKHNKMAFSSYDMAITVPLVWTNLSSAELSEYYTASIRIGNDEDGYETVWTTRLLKNKEFDLPSEEELRELIDWNDYKYAEGSGYGDQPLYGLTLIDNVVYDYNLDYQTYSVTVHGIQNPDGSTESRTYYADFGEEFDFSDLNETGTIDYTNNIFTAFSGLTFPEGVSLDKPIDSKLAKILSDGLELYANYENNSVTATFVFTGIDAATIEVTLRRGDIPSIADIETLVNEIGLAIRDIFPAIGVINGSTTYQVICGELIGPEATITFEENGGNEIADITKVEGSILGALPTPSRVGYEFAGWYIDEEMTILFDKNKMPVGGAVLYANWIAGASTVTFHVNGGNTLSEEITTLSITFNAPYGPLPSPERTGYGFTGWFTAAVGGELITAETLVSVEGSHTLYAQWRKLEEIPSTVFDFGEAETFTYERGVAREVTFTLTPEEGKTYSVDQFTIRYMRQGDSEYVDTPVNAGTYNVTVSRPGDNTYSKFEYTYPAALVINKAIRPDAVVAVQQVDQGYTWMELQLLNDNSIPGMPIVNGGIYDLSEDAIVIFNLIAYDTYVYSSNGVDNIVRDVEYHGGSFDTSVTVIDPNYEDWTSRNDNSDAFYMNPVPSGNWTDEGNYDIAWYVANPEAKTFSISTAAELAGLAYLVNNSLANAFYGKTINLTADIDLTGHYWIPIGNGGTTGQDHFAGIFDGNGHTISGVFTSNNGKVVGLFGYVLSYYFSIKTFQFVQGEPCEIRNIVLDDSVISGKCNVGGIVGFAEGISNEFDVKIINCVNYAEVSASAVDTESIAGGIAGYLYNAEVKNCVNYGSISGAERHIGGIVGLAEDGYNVIGNNANFGTVFGSSRLGGIVGCTDGDDNYVYNNYNAGKISSYDSNDFIGAIVGRNVNDNGKVKNNYYLNGTATGKNGKSRAALGKDGGSVSDGSKGYIASSFISLLSPMSSAAGDYKGQDLMTALNNYADTKESYHSWLPNGPDGYPIPANNSVSNLRK